ncbi:histidine kinase [Proteiniclasticum sp.]|uniref:sensor histidine kinase n=1 Tax=Proteiniclasticum sp. TaxID=2053595 RepID=UPI0028A18348|nr:histidine kinase [Proteiniclasticum sp.]
MENTGQFKQEMKKSVIKEIITMLIKVSALFVFALLSATFIKNEYAADESLIHIRNTFKETYDANRSFLLDKEAQRLYGQIAENGESMEEFQNLLYRQNLGRNISTDVIIMDENFNIEYTTYNISRISTYHYSYNNAVSYNARNIGENEVYTSVYNDSEGYSDLMMVKPIHNEEGELTGYITLFLLGDDWSYYMSHYNFNGVVTDQRNNVIFYNKPSLLNSNYKFSISKAKITYIGEERYWLKYEDLPEYGVKIYALVPYPKNPEILIGLVVILIIGMLWYNLANRISETMAEKNTQSISKLVSEIRIIRKYDQSHRIVMDTKDEFEDVAHQINNMLSTITSLNDRNTELLKLNSTIEINHLTAQINPHFLYNTLEIIRNLLIFDKDQAGKLIIQLTKVLRYSINNTKRDVMLDEDMQFIEDYLSIQKSRFSDRLSCLIDIDEDCRTSIVPKLILQPLIENSIKYGFMDAMDLEIRIRGYREGDYLYLIIKDNGPGMGEEEIEALYKTLNEASNNTRSNGLYNIYRRLKLKYSEKSEMKIRNNEDKGLQITLKIYQGDLAESLPELLS